MLDRLRLRFTRDGCTISREALRQILEQIIDPDGGVGG